MTDDRRAVLEGESALRNLLCAYFHQDWQIDDPDEEAVIRRFVSENPLDCVRQAERELEQLRVIAIGGGAGERF
jgi:hypothetical protein